MTSYLHKDDELIEKQLGAYTANAEKISDMGGQLSVLGQQLDQSFISNLVLDGLMQEVLGPKVREGDGFFNQKRIDFELAIQKHIIDAYAEVLEEAAQQESASRLVTPDSYGNMVGG